MAFIFDSHKLTLFQYSDLLGLIKDVRTQNVSNTGIL